MPNVCELGKVCVCVRVFLGKERGERESDEDEGHLPLQVLHLLW